MYILIYINPDEDSHMSKPVNQSHQIFKCLLYNKIQHSSTRTVVELAIYQHLYIYINVHTCVYKCTHICCVSLCVCMFVSVCVWTSIAASLQFMLPPPAPLSVPLFHATHATSIGSSSYLRIHGGNNPFMFLCLSSQDPY